MTRENIEKSLKRFLKRKVSYSISLLVSFMITGVVSFANVDIVTDRTELLTKIEKQKEEITELEKKNEKEEKNLDVELYDLLRKADFYSKSPFASSQVFFSMQKENTGSVKNNTQKEWSQNISDINNFMNRRTLRVLSRSTRDTSTRAIEDLLGNNGVMPNSHIFKESINLGANIILREPSLPSIEVEVNADVDSPEVTVGAMPADVSIQSPSIASVNIPTAPTVAASPSINVSLNSPETVEAISVEVPKLSKPTKPQAAPPKAPALNAPTVEEPVTPEAFTAKMIAEAVEPAAIEVKTPSVLTPPSITFNGSGFGQGAGIRQGKGQIVVENFESYNTIKPVDIEVGTTAKWTDGMTMTTNEDTSFNKIGKGTFPLAAGTSSGEFKAFINELRDHDMTLAGDYTIKDLGGGSSTKIFLSQNPAGLGGKPGGAYDGTGEPAKRTTTFKGHVKLKGIDAPNNTNVLVGVEHQLWGLDDVGASRNDWNNKKAYSVFLNKGTIELVDGYNVIGIMIDVEAMTDETRALNETINEGTIHIKNKRSIGIDYGDYEDNVFRSSMTHGNIIVEGEENYGVRMNDVKSPNYYDRGTFIKSGGGTILVKGKKNVGMSISKYLSAAKSDNPIANMSNINITVDGDNDVGFLRNANYSNNNTKDMILDSNTMGCFTFGENAKNSTLIRSDRYGIQIKKDISANKAGLNNSFAQASKEGKIYNHATLHSENINDIIAMIASKDGTVIPEVQNVGKIHLDASKGIGMAALNGAKLVNSGEIISGKPGGEENIAIYNSSSTAEILGGSKLTAIGEKSSVIYNVGGDTKITDNVNIDGQKGATGLYASGGSIVNNAGSSLNISVSSGTGSIAYANKGGVITLGEANLTGCGSAGIVSSGAGSKIDIQGGKLNYSGSGYAIYSQDGGDIFLENATISLDKSATGMDLDFSATGASKIHTNDNTKIDVLSDDVIVYNLSNVNNAMKVSTLAKELSTISGIKNIDSSNNKKHYKLASLDGGKVVIDTAIDKKEEVGISADYFRRFIHQRTKLDVNANVTAELSSKEAEDFDNQVVALEMSSNAKASSIDETKIHVKPDVLVKADRTDGTDKGAVGAYINYGKMIQEGKFEIESGDNPANSNAVGIYAVNGSQVENKGDIKVRGNNSIGLLGLGSRIKDGNVLKDEFGGKTGEGTIKLQNSGNLILDGGGSVGIYAKNNAEKSASDIQVTNASTGTIKVGDSENGKSAIGIYGDKATISNQGKINVGKDAVAIYAKNGSTVQSGGNLELAEGGIGVILDATSEITGNGFTFTAIGDKQTGIYLEGDNGSAKTISSDIDLQNSESAIGLFSNNGKVEYGSGKNIKVGNKSIGIYGKGNQTEISNKGNIQAKENSIGIFASEGSLIKEAGTINLGKQGVGIMLDKNSNLDSGATLTLSSNAEEQTAVYLNGDSGSEKIISMDLDLQSSKKGIAIYAKNASAKNSGDIKLGEKGVALYLDTENANSTLENSAKIDLLQNSTSAVGMYAEKAVGMYAEKGKLKNTGNIVLAGDKQTAMYGNGAETQLINSGSMELNSDNANGIYAENKATAQLNENTMKMTGKKDIGVFASDAKVKILGNSTLSTANENENIYVYGKEADIEIAATGSLEIDGKALPTTAEDKNKKSIAFYLEGENKFANKGNIKVKNGAIGIYSKEANNLENKKIEVEGKSTTGIFLEKGGSLTGGTQLTLSKGGLGIYSSGDLDLKEDINMQITDKGSGVYLSNSALSGKKLDFTGNVAANNIAVYYDKNNTEDESKTLEHSSELSLHGDKVIGLYTDHGVEVENKKDITSDANQSMGIYVAENAKYSSDKNITMTGEDNLGIYVGKGSAENSGNIDLSSAKVTAGSGVNIAMVAKTGAASEKAQITNSGNILLNSGEQNVGMYIAGAGRNEGTNTKEISGDGLGIHLEGKTSYFTNTGTIKTKAGIYAKDTDKGQITAGNLEITDGGIGVIAEDAEVDFDIHAKGNEITALYANVTGNDEKKINSEISAEDGSLGVYLQNNKAVIDGGKITVGKNTASKTAVGIYAKDAGQYDINAEIHGKDGVGIFLGEHAAKDLKFDGSIETEGVGIYVTEGNTVETALDEDTDFYINKGVGIYLDKGSADIGNTAHITNFHFGDESAIGIYSNGGSVNLGNNLKAIGKDGVEGSTGTLVGTRDGDLTVAGANIETTNLAKGILAIYGSGTSTDKTLSFQGNLLKATKGAIGIAAIKDGSLSGGTVSLENAGTIKASGKYTDKATSVEHGAIGIYTDIAKVTNSGTIEVGKDAIGIYASESQEDIKNTGDLNLVDENAIGIYANGSVGAIDVGNISGGNRTKALVLNKLSNDVRLDGNISLGKGSFGVLANDSDGGTKKEVSIDGTVVLGDSIGEQRSMGIVAEKGADLKISGTGSIEVGNGGIGYYAKDAGTKLEADIDMLQIGEDGIYAMADKSANLHLKGNGTALVDGGIGVLAKDSAVLDYGAKLKIQNGGLGVYIDSANANSHGGSIELASGGSKAKRNIGVYYKDMNLAVPTLTVLSSGDYGIGAVFDNTSYTTNKLNFQELAGNNNISYALKNNSDVHTGDISIQGGERNVGFYVENSSLKAEKITVGSPNSGGKGSIGVYLKDGAYTGNGNFDIHDNAIGLYAENLNNKQIQQTGEIKVGKEGLGLYASGSGNVVLNNPSGNVLDIKDSAIGVYVKDIDLQTNGNMEIGKDTAVGIVSEGTGKVVSSGDYNIGEKSIGIYKKGLATRRISLMSRATSELQTSGDWNIGKESFGVFVEEGNQVLVKNAANLDLGESAVGIYAAGSSHIENSGTINVGKTNVKGNHEAINTHQNSVGIFLKDGATAENKNVLKVNHDHSLGVYAKGNNTKFVNSGDIYVDGGGVGVLAAEGAIAENKAGANIYLGNTLAPTGCSAESVGMAVQQSSKIINNGEIHVGKGIGMNIAFGGEFANNGRIIVDNGVGIEGEGRLVNTGTIVYKNSSSTGELIATNGNAKAEFGAITLHETGKIVVGGNYISIGGTIVSPVAIDIQGAFLDPTKGSTFCAPTVTGNINLTSNFLTQGNGVSWKYDNFLGEAGNLAGALHNPKPTSITVNASPFILTKLAQDKSLLIALKAYGDITVGTQFDNIYNGAFNLLGQGKPKDQEILKDMNRHLHEVFTTENIGNPGATRTEKSMKCFGKYMSELRGDVYATIQERMDNINQSFNRSYEELLSSYNRTKDVGKYSVIYSEGEYRNDTLGIDDYDYKTEGLLYMRDIEGIDLYHKYGYSLGFAHSNFDFVDNKSEEKVLSGRIGAHHQYCFENAKEMTLLNRLELGYNRHRMKRSIKLHNDYSAKGSYNTYSVALDNRLKKSIYQDFTKSLSVYGDVNMSYGRIDGFKERGDLALEVKKQNDWSTEVGVGATAAYRKHLKDNYALKLTADSRYTYETADSYHTNQSRIKDGGLGYAELINPEKKKGAWTNCFGIGIEKGMDSSLTFEVRVKDEERKEKKDINYAVRFKYSF